MFKVRVKLTKECMDSWMVPRDIERRVSIVDPELQPLG